MKTKQWFSFLSLILALTQPLSAGQTIAEKKHSIENGGIYLDVASADDLREVNATLVELRAELKDLYQEASSLYETAHEGGDRFFALLKQINHIKAQISEVELLWKKEVIHSNTQEQYGLMHAPDLLLSDFVMDYGASDCLYIIPPEMEQMRLHITSNIPIPKESWQECLECILSRYGIAVKTVNTYIRELYFSTNNYSGLAAITDSLEQLALMPPKAHVCFVVCDEESDARGSVLFFRKFCNPQTTTVELFGGRVFILSSAETIQELFKLYKFVKAKTGKQQIQLVTLTKLDAAEMCSILQIAFNEGPYPEESGLRIMALQSLDHSLVLAGSKEEIKRAKKIIEEVESNLQNPDENTLFWYTAKHSDPEELASVIAQVYDLLINTSPATLNNEKIDAKIAEAKKNLSKEDKERTGPGIPPTRIIPAHTGSAGVGTGGYSHHNFVVDPKTGSIMMVVKRDLLIHIKQLLKKLDIPKKMVQIEVLLFEKKMENHSKCGLNLLKLGSSAVNAFASGGASFHKGILEFFISRDKGSGIPAYDLAYNFLLGQEDVQINASPSVTTMNQTPATIAIVEEISIDGGSDDKKNRIYNRAQYGITLLITPTINMDCEDQEQFITLDTDITFDTTKNSGNDRPDVTRRHIKNHVRIKDGETVILGGLRRKNQEDKKDSIPFLGDIPGLGKLFSCTEINDSSTEMFIFITPKILSDPIEVAENTRIAALTKRAGDLPEFLEELDIAKDKQKRKLFERSITSLFGRQEERKKPRMSQGEYDGHE